MKKLLAILLIITITVSMFAACNGAKEVPAETEKDVQTEEPNTTEPLQDTTTEVEKVEDFVYPGGIRLGLAVETSVSDSKAAADGKNGVAETESIVVAVLLDEEGKINKIVTDAVKAEIEFDDKGQLVTVDETFKTKRELGNDYGMKAVSGIEKEWFEQADAIEAYVLDKTLEEIRGIAIDDKGVAVDADLSAGATIDIGRYISTIEKAIINSQDTNALLTDGLGLGITTHTGQSVSVEDDKNGLAQADSSYTAITVDSNGIISGAAIDASKCEVEFDVDGKIVSDLETPSKTKTELGSDYGMKAVSPIGKEWNEQAAALAKYLVGKSYDEVVGVAIVDGVSTTEDLTASVTVSLSDITTALDKAYKQGVETSVETSVIEEVVDGDAPAPEDESPLLTSEEPKSVS